MFKTFKNALKTPEIRKKLLYTLLLIVLFRFGCYLTVPGVDTFTLAEQMSNATTSVAGLINTISGGAFSRLSIFAMTITPYITASIVIQLLAMIIPSLEKAVIISSIIFIDAISSLSTFEVSLSSVILFIIVDISTDSF